MPSNEQRREAAKRKLERQLERRAERARKRKQMTIAGTALGVVVVVGVVGGLIWFSNRSDDDANTTNTAADDSSLTPQTAGTMPAGLSTPLADTVSCSYPADGATASKANNPPRTDGIPTTAPDATPSISVETSQGNIGLTLDGTKSPCTVNSFVSLAQQDYFNDTTCHRMTTSPSLQVLQCGDPSGTGSGGPGYGFDNEFPTTAYATTDPAAQEPVTYARGTVAMANTGTPGSNGSQFFLVYGDSQLPPQYTVFGTIDETGLATLDKVAAGGSTPEGDGKPNLTTDIKTVRLD
ncbi:peptidyl-prolyl cis-trans isomerase [Rhodococcus erythropolis CCM2595]|uniref:peptidylprolyl isomerase n=1 Tax=Rhodococcus erythropolis TaxID=1833 RepID=UPI00038DCA1C|nr:peptidylprolyl isomerase [Rhodococcus erythropolis]AGT92532.1 peptidyl-prolyl cis-trans isomerase [Rhodococcus erythropolis CCM2595]SUE13126.1 peptidyl-prolyl cis-trans isomerase [Rhodococcus erythropolis]